MSTAQSQQTRKVYRIAIAHPSAPATDLTEKSRGSLVTPVILEELRRLEYVEGQNLLIERYSGEGCAGHYPDLARDVVRRNPDVIIAMGLLNVDLKAATNRSLLSNPVELGIVQGLARPGGNVIGVSNNIGDDDQWDKRIQLLKELVLQATRLGWVETRVLRDQYDAAELEQCRQMGLTRVGPALNHPIDE